MKREKIETYIENTRKHLIAEYGEVKPDWELTLDIMEDNLNVICDMQEKLKETGVFTGGKKNPLIVSIKDCQTLLLKLSQKLGNSPYDVSKIKKLEEDGTDDFLDSLTKEDE